MHVFKTLSLLSKPYAGSVVLAERKWIRWGEILKVVSSARPIVHERVTCSYEELVFTALSFLLCIYNDIMGWARVLCVVWIYNWVIT